jgi:hypothetical protein
MEWDAKVPISEIELSKSEKKVLLAIKKSGIYAESQIMGDVQRLRHFGLAEVQSVPAKDGIPKVSSIGLAQKVFITDKGKDYLAYIHQRDSQKKSDYIHDWMIAVVSALAGAFLSEPLWTLLRTMLSMLSQ